MNKIHDKTVAIIGEHGIDPEGETVIDEVLSDPSCFWDLVDYYKPIMPKYILSGGHDPENWVRGRLERILACLTDI